MAITIAACDNCNLTKRLESRGMCYACYRYWKRHGENRPARYWQRPILCKLCLLKPVKSKGLCHRCYEYKRNNGTDRPLHLRNLNSNCLNPNCGKSLGDIRTTKQYCKACYSYRWHHNNEDRPIRLCKNQPTADYRPCHNPNCDKPVKINASRGRYCYPCHNYQIANAGQNRPASLCPKFIQ